MDQFGGRGGGFGDERDWNWGGNGPFAGSWNNNNNNWGQTPSQRGRRGRDWNWWGGDGGDWGPSQPSNNNNSPLGALIRGNEFRASALRLAGKRVRNVCQGDWRTSRLDDSYFIALPKAFFPRNNPFWNSPLCAPNTCIWVASRNSGWGNVVLRVKWAWDTRSMNVAMSDSNLQTLGGDGIAVRYRLGPCRLWGQSEGGNQG